MKSHSTGTPINFKIKLEYQNSKGPKIVFQLTYGTLEIELGRCL